MDEELREIERRWRESEAPDDAKEFLAKLERYGWFRVTRTVLESVVRTNRLFDHFVDQIGLTMRRYDRQRIHSLLTAPVTDAEILSVLGFDLPEPPAPVPPPVPGQRQRQEIGSENGRVFRCRSTYDGRQCTHPGGHTGMLHAERVAPGQGTPPIQWQVSETEAAQIRRFVDEA